MVTNSNYAKSLKCFEKIRLMKIASRVNMPQTKWVILAAMTPPGLLVLTVTSLIIGIMESIRLTYTLTYIHADLHTR